MIYAKMIMVCAQVIVCLGIGTYTMIKFRPPWHINLSICTDHLAAEEGAYGAGVGGYSKCSNDYNILAVDHVMQPNMPFVCFDVHASGTLKSLLTVTMFFFKKKLKTMKQEPKAIVKVQNQIIIMKQSSYMNLSPQFHRESHNAEANKHGIGADSP